MALAHGPEGLAGQQRDVLNDLNLNSLPISPKQHANIVMGQSSSSESKGLKRAAPYMRGAATSFGFRKNKAANSTKGDAKGALEHRDYSQEALSKEQHNVTTSIKASPGLVRAASAGSAAASAAASAAPSGTRTNRFGFKPVSANSGGGNGVRGLSVLSNKVADSSAQVLATQVSVKPVINVPPRPAGTCTPGRARNAGGPNPRGPASRPSPPNSLSLVRKGQQSHLPRPQFARCGNAKDAKTTANNGTRGLAPMATFDDEIGSSKESSMNEDSGLGSQLTGDTDTLHGLDGLDISPRGSKGLSRLRRGTPGPRASRRSLRDEDDDPNVITEIVPIAKVVSRASLRSITSLGGKNNIPSPKQLSVKGSVSSKASSDEFHSDSMLFRDYGDGLDDGVDDGSEPKVYIDCKTAEKTSNAVPCIGRGTGRQMMDFGMGCGMLPDDDWGQGEDMAEVDLSNWNEKDRDVSGEIGRNIPAVPCDIADAMHPGIPDKFMAEIFSLAGDNEEHGLIEDESAPEDSLFSSGPSSTSEDSPLHSPAQETTRRQRVRIKKREREAKDEAKANDGTKEYVKKSEKIPVSGESKKEGHMLSPEGSATPSNSFSLSDGRDFLIDDEIIDQPALTIHSKIHGDDSEMASLAESAASITLRDSSHNQVHPGGQGGISRSLKKSECSGQKADGDEAGSIDVRPMSRDNTLMMARFGSLDSFATNSIDSEDLMMDFEEEAESKRYRSITKSWAGSPVMFWPRPRKSKSFSAVDLDQLKSVEGFARRVAKNEATRVRSQSVGVAPEEEDENELVADNDSVLLELTSLIESVRGPSRIRDGLARYPRAIPAGPAVSGSSQGFCSGPSSAPDSPRYSLGSSGAPSPLRPPRQLASSDSDESAMMRVDRGTYQHMYQDVVHIKTMLLKLKRVLQEAETLNPFESSLKNGLLHHLVHADESGEDEDGKIRNPDEEVVDLKRQMVLMKQQMEEKDRTIQLMQVQMMKYERLSEDSNDDGHPADMCNAATQTERIRPVSAGPSLLQSLPADSNGTPLVSWTDTWGRRSRTPAGGGSSVGSSVSENRTASSSRVPTMTLRSSRSIIPGHQRLSVGNPGDSPSSIPLVRGHHRKTATAMDSVPNTRRPPVVAAPRKAVTSSVQKP